MAGLIKMQFSDSYQLIKAKPFFYIVELTVGVIIQKIYLLNLVLKKYIILKKEFLVGWQVDYLLNRK